MAELDVMLSATLKRAANPGDPTGVADAIRARVAAGDTGTPASTSGFGSGRWWLAWIGLAVAALLVTGGAVVFGAPWPSSVIVEPTASSGSTPRPTGSVSASASATPTPTPTPTLTPTPTPTVEPAPPAPAPDVTAPTITVPTASNAMVYTANATSTTISVTASDDVGVAAVTITWSGYQSGTAPMQPGWTYLYTVPQAVAPPPGSTITFTVQAVDAAGNVSAPQSVVVGVGF